MDEKLKKLTKELGQAIDQAINDSPEVKELTQKIKDAGYETFLMVEATICFARHEENNQKIDQDLVTETDQQKAQEFSSIVSKDDLQFLKSLKISIEDMDN
ncbi:MAG: hypothetical protein JNN15_01410 [Blastocatellia bacterium]|nr:hypothetical protein [Blastocatellia bacterium]